MPDEIRADRLDTGAIRVSEIEAGCIDFDPATGVFYPRGHREHIPTLLRQKLATEAAWRALEREEARWQRFRKRVRAALVLLMLLVLLSLLPG